MSNQAKLSQEEIDALLRQTAPEPEPEAQNTQGQDESLLSDEERDVLGEIGNISFGSASTALSTLLQQRVEITTPDVRMYRAEDLHSEFPRPYVMVSVEYTAGLKGTNALAIELQDAKTIADLMLGGDGSNTDGELQELHLSAVAEAMNQMMGGAATSMSTIFSMTINISPPNVTFMDLSSADDLDIGLSGWVACVAFRLKVGSLIDSELMQLIPVDFARSMVSLLMHPGQGQPAETGVPEAAATVETVAAPTAEPASRPTVPQAASAPAASSSSTEPALVPGGGGMPLSQPRQETQPAAAAAPRQSAQVLRPEFTEFEPNSGRREETPRNLALILDVNLSVTVELGRTKRPIREILDLTPGSVIELDKLAGEAVDILVNNRRIALGEVVVIDENFGVRVTDIVDASDRIRSLQ